MQRKNKTATELFNEFKKVFTNVPFENIDQLIGYCEIHSRTERALFHISQVLLLNILNGDKKESILELKKKVDAGAYAEFTPIYADEMNSVLESIKAQIG